MQPDISMYVFLELGAYALGIAHFACTIVLLIRWAILRTARTRGRIIRPDMHKYVSVRYPMSFKVLALFVIGGYVLAVFPAGVYFIAREIIEEIGQDINPLIPAGIAAGVGLLILIAIARVPMCHKEVSATVDSRGLTIEYKDGERTTIGVRGYKGYIGETKKHAFRLAYEGEDGKDTYVYLPFLSANDAIAVGKDLNTLRDHGYIEPPKNADARAAAPVRTAEETKKIQEKLAYTEPINSGAKIEDTDKYRAYLEDVLKKIPFDTRDNIIKLVAKGDKAEAMRVCQRASGEGLRIAMDLFSNYLMFPNLKYFSCRIYVQVADRESIRKSFKEYNELYTDPDKCYISAEGDLDSNWHYIELSPSAADPTGFTFAEFMNILIWMSELTFNIFAYGEPNNTYPGMGNNAIDKVGDWTNTMPFYAVPDRNDELTESVLGIMNSKQFRFVFTELDVSYKGEVAPGFDFESYIYQNHKVRV